MFDDIKPAILSEGESDGRRNNEDQENLPRGDAGAFDRFNPGAVPPDHAGPASDTSVETPSRTATISPSIEAEPGDDPQAPNRKGEG